MTIEPHAGNHVAIPQQDTTPDDSPLVQWAYAASKANQIAQSLARTSFVPASLRNKPDDITAAILAGQELGLQPMATLRSMDVIQGTPALRAHAMRGLVQSHGHTVQLVESTPDTCVMRGRRKGEGEGDWQAVTWTIQRAQQLGLASKDQWKKQPTAMLVARATGEICRLIAADVLYAMPYAAEELDGRTDRGESARPSVTVAEIHARGQEQAGASAPVTAPQPQEFGAFEPFDSGEPLATPEQIGEIQRGAPEAGFHSPQELLEFADREMGMAADRLEDLSATEAKTLIDRLRSLAADSAA